MLTRRQFVKAALAAGAASAVPPFLESFLQAARAGTPANFYFFNAQRDGTGQLEKTCRALCDRIVPGPDGATDASAVVFIDRFLSAFELPTLVADRPAIWFTGDSSGRSPSPDNTDGKPSSTFPSDAFLDSRATGHFLGLTPAQALSWRYQLYGTAEITQRLPAWASGQTQPDGKTPGWAALVQNGTIPSPMPADGLQRAYEVGLAKFDSWSVSMFGTHFSDSTTQQQDLMLELAGNVVVNAVTGNVPLPWPSPPTAPPEASALFPIITLHTFQATYGLPEYSWRNQVTDATVEVVGPTVTTGGTAQWRAIGYDGDTQPLGNSIFDANMYGPGEGPNAGFGAAPGSDEAANDVYVPFGGYTEYRPMSYLDPNSTPLSAADAATLETAINRLRGLQK